MIKINLNREEQLNIAAAVKKAESSTSGEISTAIIAESSDYAFYELRASLAFAAVLYIIQIRFFPQLSSFVDSFYWNSPAWLAPMLVGMISFLGGGLFYFFSNLPAVDRFIIPKAVMEKKVKNRALRHFTESGVYATDQGTGILIFISLMERRVEILADRGINEKISEDEWNTIVSALSGSLQKGQTAAGLIRAIEHCGEKLQEHFPIQKDDVNELSDDLVILED